MLYTTADCGSDACLPMLFKIGIAKLTCFRTSFIGIGASRPAIILTSTDPHLWALFH